MNIELVQTDLLETTIDLPAGFLTLGQYEEDDTDAEEIFFAYADGLMSCGAGRKVWTSTRKVKDTICGSRDLVSVSDEVFLLLCLENYWEKWTIVGAKAKWTDARGGNVLYGGWADGLERYVELHQLVKTSRDSVQRKANEKTF